MTPKDQPMEIPEVLQGLGLSQEQLRQVQAYFRLRVDLARQQRMILAGLAMMFLAPLLVSWLRPEAGQLPFETLLDVFLRWVPAAGLVMGCIALGLKQFIANGLDKKLPGLGLSERALRQIRSLTRTIVLVAIFGKLLDLFYKRIGVADANNE